MNEFLSDEFQGFIANVLQEVLKHVLDQALRTDTQREEEISLLIATSEASRRKVIWDFGESPKEKELRAECARLITEYQREHGKIAWSDRYVVATFVQKILIALSKYVFKSDRLAK